MVAHASTNQTNPSLFSLFVFVRVFISSPPLPWSFFSSTADDGSLMYTEEQPIVAADMEVR